MLARPRLVSRRGPALLLALVLALGTLLTGALAVAPATAAAPAAGLLPLTVTNDSGLPGSTYLYVIARDQATGAQGWVDASGTWHAFDLPGSVPDGTAPPTAPDTSVAGPAAGSSTTVHLGPGLVGGRIYVALGGRLTFSLTPGGLVEPAAWLPSDPNHEVLYDWVEFARDGSRLFVNTTMVDMFSVPLGVGVTNADGTVETQGTLVPGGRAQVFADLAADPQTAGLVQLGEDGEPVRAIAPVHGIHQGMVSDEWFDDYVAEAWSYYATSPLTVDTAMGSFTGRVTDGAFVFRDAARTVVATFAAPTTADVLACQGALQPIGQPDQTAALAIGARLCAAFNRGTLSTASVAGSDRQPTSDADAFYPADGTSNLYAAAMHRSQANGLAYGFAFDDVADFSPSINSAQPTAARLTIGSMTGETPGTAPEPAAGGTPIPAPAPAPEPVAVPAAPVAVEPAPPVPTVRPELTAARCIWRTMRWS